MKRRIEKPSEQFMRFFTPELYAQFNSQNEEVADRADAEWEKAIADYRRHLETIRDDLPSQVKQLAELCLHDAEILGFERELQSFLPVSVAVLSLKQDDTIRSLIYMLWDRVREYPASKDWPFSPQRKHWLYDEVDVASDRRRLFLHRVLFSDGSVVEIPFVSAIISSVTLPAADAGGTRRIA